MKTLYENFEITNYIPVGHKNAVSRTQLELKTGIPDRQIRAMIAESPAKIVNLGYGYFIPDERDEVDMAELISYTAQERERIRSLIDKFENKFGVFEIAHNANVETNEHEEEFEIEQ